MAKGDSVRENIEMIAGIYGNSSNTARIKADAMIDLFGLAETAKVRAKTLSGGLPLGEPQIAVNSPCTATL